MSLFRMGGRVINSWGWRGYLALFSRQSEYANSSHRPCPLTSSSQEPGKFRIFQVKSVVFGVIDLDFYKKFNSQNIIGAPYGSYFDISFCGETLRTSTLRFWPA